ncbi:alpha/beta fold hydrolase [Thalassobius sp. Cn5-15]|uniref:alpha/beta fold hydrolase n=1 Tax=Thalassobius sp. Cn5-15 TaxID=2917763 RepID=UPI001EF1ED5D|nr:alpha/beta fold hydrolase [Thalassobius sp. Cn5-15]MCG7494429.1 alpha/beta hydrolase [Thalassobius sp. Cn5-15]
MVQEPIVLLPGMMCDARMYAPQVAVLSRVAPVTVAPICLGDTIEEIAQGLLAQLPPQFALAGLSMGGIVAMEMMRRAPDRISRIALMDTNALAETPQSATVYEPWIIAAKSGRLEDALREMMRPEFLAQGPQRVTVLNQFFDMARDFGPEVFVRQCRALQRRRDLQSALRRCKVPAMVLCGAEDGMTPLKRHEFMAQLIPSAQLRVIEGAGHLPTLEQPEQLTQALLHWLQQPYVLSQPA